MWKDFLKFLEVGGAAINCAFFVSENEVSEAEFFLYVIGQLHEQCPRVFL